MRNLRLSTCLATTLPALLGVALAATSVVQKFVRVGADDGSNTSTAAGFPDVCTMPGMSASTETPVPVPYTNVVSRSKSDLPPGQYALKQGGTIEIAETLESGLSGPKLTGHVSFTIGSFDARIEGKPVRRTGDRQVSNDVPAQSTLYELADGSFCAVCVANQRITRILKLVAVRPERKAPASQRQ